MKVFKNRNMSGEDVCPICKTKRQGETVLIAKAGTGRDHIAEAVQVHLECLDLWYDKKLNIIYQRIQ